MDVLLKRGTARVRALLALTRTRSGFERAQLDLQALELFARAGKHLALHVEFFSRDEIEARENAVQHGAHIFFQICRRTLREDFAQALVDVVEYFAIHGGGRKSGLMDPLSHSTCAALSLSLSVRDAFGRTFTVRDTRLRASNWCTQCLKTALYRRNLLTNIVIFTGTIRAEPGAHVPIHDLKKGK